MNNLKGKMKLYKRILIYVYIFLLIYIPQLKDLLGVESQIILALIIITLFSFNLLRIKSLMNKILQKNMFILLLGITISILYFTIITFFTNNEPRILQNAFILVQILGGITFLDILIRNGYKRYDIIIVIFNITLIQGVINILMFLIPSLKEIALFFYYQGAEENIFISKMRVFGITTDYTYFTPGMHGILAITAYILSVVKTKKFLIYIPFLIISMLLNGRTGFMIFLIGIIISSFLLFNKFSYVKKIFLYSFFMIIVSIIFILLTSIVSPPTFHWLKLGFNEILEFLVRDDNSGTLGAISSSIYFPKGIALLLGEGHRAYGHTGYLHSDIGYVNDIFMGGLLYIAVLYGSIFKYLTAKRNFSNPDDKKINDIISVVFPIVLLILNIKGETLRGGLILFIAILIKQIFLSETCDEN